MEVNFFLEDKTLIVAPSGKLDTFSAPKFGTQLAKLLEDRPESCLLDLSGVTFLSSSGLQVLLAGAKTSKKEGIRYGVFGMQEMVNDVFFLSGFNNFIDSFETKEEALS
ncbi:MAG: STAS domain-containing protein [Sulfurimonas sp.]|nr:STAS domain-containing protein [Sulfurimonas sp.]MDD3834764.1 STAS domain-containing protein [Sulfurimonas sp.]